MLYKPQRLSRKGVETKRSRSGEHPVLQGEDIVWPSKKLEAAGNAAGSVLRTLLNTSKKLPFKAKFKEFIITDPLQVNEAFSHAETRDDIHTIVIDTLTYLMDMYESQYVRTAVNGQKAWGEFAFYFKDLMQQEVARSTKNVIFLAHSADKHNEAEMVTETTVPVKGSLKNNGIESYFSLVIAAKKMPLKNLANYKSDLLTITPREEALGFKYVYQTDLTKETVNERLRGPMGLFEQQETFIDNDVQLVIDRLHSYYS